MVAIIVLSGAFFFFTAGKAFFVSREQIICHKARQAFRVVATVDTPLWSHIYFSQFMQQSFFFFSEVLPGSASPRLSSQAWLLLSFFLSLSSVRALKSSFSVPIKLNPCGINYKRPLSGYSALEECVCKSKPFWSFGFSSFSLQPAPVSCTAVHWMNSSRKRCWTPWPMGRPVMKATKAGTSA